MKPILLIVDDDEEIRSQMRWALNEDYQIFQADDKASALEEFGKKSPDVVLLDLGLPPNPNSTEEGLSILSEILALDSLTKVIIVSGQGERENAIQAIGRGAYDFIGKPVDIENLQLILKRSYHLASLEREYREIKYQYLNDSFEGMLGSSDAMQKVFESIRKVATTDAPIMILGESGTGKEMAAMAIHNRSTRKEGPFIPINCSAIPETLLESELFGHEKGSFTGAESQRIGKIEQANNGTLFLDEIGEVPLSVQVKLLRFLQEQCIERIGGREQIKINARVIAATNADLKQGMDKGTFREDFYYRLSVVEILLPALRNRDTDIDLISKAILQNCLTETGNKKLSFSKKAINALRKHKWPGNVRELQNRVRRAVIMSEGNQISPQDLELEGALESGHLTLKQAREEVERDMINRALKKHSGKISPAAAELGISRPTFYELMDKLDIKKA